MTEPDHRQRSTRQRFVTAAYALLVCVVVPSAFVTLAVHEDPGLSALDEVAHLDYLERAGNGSFARMGDIVSSDIAVTARCRDVEVLEGLPCDEVEIPTGPPAAADGYSYQAQHPPVYYWASAAMQRITEIGPGDNFITTGRLTGMFWLSLGVSALYAALRHLGVGRAVTGAVCVFLSASPGLIFSASKVTNDATSLVGGSAVLLGYVLFRERPDRRRLLLLASLSVVVVLLKPVNVVAVGAVALAAIVDLAPRIGWRRSALTSAVTAATGVATVLAWQVMVDVLARVDTDLVMDALLEFKAESDGPPIGRFVLSASGLLAAYEAGTPVVGAGATAVSVVGRFSLLGATVTAGLRERRTTATLLGVSGVVVAIAAGFAFNVQFWASFGLRNGPAARYGLSLLPLLAVPLAVAAGGSRRSTVGVWVLALVMVVTSTTGIVLNS